MSTDIAKQFTTNYHKAKKNTFFSRTDKITKKVIGDHNARRFLFVLQIAMILLLFKMWYKNSRFWGTTRKGHYERQDNGSLE